MYTKSKSVHVKSSASLLYNNLSALVIPDKQLTTYAVVHKTVANLGCCSLSESSAVSISHKQVSCKEPSITHASSILQAKFCCLSGRNILVLCSQQGVQMFESDGSVMVFWYALPAAESTQGLLFTRGIAVLPDNLIAIGENHYGGILVFRVPSQGTNVTLCQTLKCHDYPITAIATEGAVMASADDSGGITVWEAVQDQIGRVIMHIPGGLQQMVIAGYGSGHIRIFDAFKATMMVEVCAHARWIHAIDLAPDSGLLVSTSEDTFVRVWSILKKQDDVHIQLEHTEKIQDTQLTGVQFLDPNGQSFSVSGYDSNVLNHFTKVN
ncbi:putative WD repeat-containing protein 54 isoform X2 [Apostichopus japonicus]|uniref:Putative WD repeat-containing protein 54 isoform X2 n=1 Tax=Stichopus japonicus TaxID=307972 RepID=A0A2G8KLC1_STIJA|nr:putative WD repeat-containing protein 54 isoform X2 [Apostichopus japonicus]